MSLLQAEHTDRYEFHVHIVSYLAHTKALLIKQTRFEERNNFRMINIHVSVYTLQHAGLRSVFQQYRSSHYWPKILKGCWNKSPPCLPAFVLLLPCWNHENLLLESCYMNVNITTYSKKNHIPFLKKIYIYLLKTEFRWSKDRSILDSHGNVVEHPHILTIFMKIKKYSYFRIIHSILLYRTCSTDTQS